MKLGILVSLATIVSTAALAQAPSNAYRGSGIRAGGPAYLLNSETGGPVKAVRREIALSSYRHSGQRAGGPAADLNVGGTGTLSLQGTIFDPARVVPFGTARSGHAAGGPLRQ